MINLRWPDIRLTPKDHLLDSLSVQPNVQSLIGGKGVTYNKHYCTVAWCCPSRVNYFTGRTAHNTNLTSAQAPYGMSHISSTIAKLIGR
jgi:arylsulfatase A-like enzyme